MLCPFLIYCSAAPGGVAGKVPGFLSPCFPYTYIVAQTKDYKQAVAADSSGKFHPNTDPRNLEQLRLSLHDNTPA